MGGNNEEIIDWCTYAWIGNPCICRCFCKKRGDGKFDIHWSYPNPRAQEVYLAGDFTNWGEGKQLMDRDENGGWYFDMVVPSGTVFKYKFVVDGEWLTDVNGPEFTGDGLGGKNTVINVNKLTRPAKKKAKK